MKLNATNILIKSGVGDDIALLLEQAISQHVETGRAASVTLKITVKMDKETGKSRAKARVQAMLPDGEDDAVVKKQPTIGILTLTNDHPGQQRIDGSDEPADNKSRAAG